MSEMKPSLVTSRLIRQMLVDCWQIFKTTEDPRLAENRVEITHLDAKHTKLLDRILATENDAVARAFEGELAKLENEKRLMEAKMADIPKTRGSFQESFRTAFEFLSNPRKLWASEHYAHK
ncbi:MAG: hypothetical protein AAFY83_01770 [Pseudomonadota bacterium]